MLRILDVNSSGFFSFGIHDTIQLDDLGVTLLEGLNHDRGGSANGAGKTSLFNTISEIIFGKNPTEYSGEATVNKLIGKQFGKVTFEDKHGVKWRVISTRKWRKTDKYPCQSMQEPSEWHNLGEKYSGTDVYLERWDPVKSIWIDERATNTAGEHRLELKATRKKVLEVVGLSYQQFMNVAYLAQQQSLKFVNGTHKEKLEVLSELSDIGVWDKRQAKVKEAIKTAESEIDRLNATLQGATRTGSILSPPSLNEKFSLMQSIARLQDSTKVCDDKIKSLSDQSAAWKDAVAQIIKDGDDARAEIRQLTIQRNQINDQISKAGAQYIQICTTIRNKPRAQRIKDIEFESMVLKSKVHQARMDMDNILPGGGKCPRCLTMVPDHHLIRHRELLTAEIKENEEQLRVLHVELVSLNAEWEQTVVEELDTAELRYKQEKYDLQSAIGLIDMSISSTQTRIGDLQRRMMGLGQDPQQLIAAESGQRMQIVSMISRETERLSDFDKRQAQWDVYQKTLEDSKANIIKHESQLRMFRIIERAFGDKGIKAHKLGTVLALLNKTVQEFADILTNSSVKVWVTPFREKSDGTQSTDMQIMVQEGDKQDVPFGLYSGGEKQQIVLAFIGAFWQVATMQGSGVNILCLDEIFGPLDEVNAQGVFAYLDHMKKQGKSTIMVVTHDNNIKNQLNFDRKWLVEKRDHISTLSTAA